MVDYRIVAILLTGIISSCSDEIIPDAAQGVSAVSSNRGGILVEKGEESLTSEVRQIVAPERKTVIELDLGEKLKGSTITIQPGTFRESTHIIVTRAASLLSGDHANSLNLDDDAHTVSEAVNVAFEDSGIKTIPVPITVSLQISSQGLNLSEDVGNIFVVYTYRSESGEQIPGTLETSETEINGQFAVFKTVHPGTYQLVKSDGLSGTTKASDAKGNEFTMNSGDTDDETLTRQKEAETASSESDSPVEMNKFALKAGGSSGEVLGSLVISSELDYFQGHILRDSSGNRIDCLDDSGKVILKFSSNEGREFLFLDRTESELESFDYKVCIFDVAANLVGERKETFITTDKTLPPFIILKTVYTNGDKEVPEGSFAMKVLVPEDASDIELIKIVQLRDDSASSCSDGVSVKDLKPAESGTVVVISGDAGQNAYFGICTIDSSQNMRFQMHGGHFRMDHLIVLSKPTSGQLGSLEKADEYCASSNPALNGVIFKALLSDSGRKIDARSRLILSGYIRTFGGETFATPSEMWSAKNRVPVAYDSEGNRFFGNDTVFTGTKADGTASGADCNSWTSDDAARTAGSGNRLATGGAWVDEGTYSCDTSRFIYCISQSRVDFTGLVIPQ